MTSVTAPLPPPTGAPRADALSATAEFADRCRRAASDPKRRVGLSVWCSLLALGRVPKAGAVCVDFVPGKEGSEFFQTELTLSADAPAIALGALRQHALDDWFDARLDTLAVQRPGPLPSQLAGVACLLDLSDVLALWPGPHQGRWRNTDILAVLRAAEQLQRWATPVLLHSVLGEIVALLKAWGLSQPLAIEVAGRGAAASTDALVPLAGAHVARGDAPPLSLLARDESSPWLLVVGDGAPQRPVAQMAQAMVAAARPAPAAPHAVPPATPSTGRPEMPEAQAPSASGKAKKKNKKKKAVAGQGTHTVDALARAWAEAAGRRDKAAPAALSRLMGALLAAGDGPEATDVWRSCLTIAGRTSADCAWTLVAEARNELLFAPAPCMADALLPLGAPAGAEPCREAHDTLLRLARAPGPLPTLGAAATRGLLAMATRDQTRVPALCVAARMALQQGSEGDMPLSELAEHARRAIEAQYARALRRDGADVAGVLPLVAFAFGNVSAEALATHFLPLSDHGHLADQQVAAHLCKVLQLRPDVLAVLPLGEAPWRDVARQALRGFTPLALDDLCRRPGETRADVARRALGHAGRMMHLADEHAAPRICATWLAELAAHDATLLETNLVLALAGDSLQHLVTRFGHATRHGGDDGVPLDALQSWAMLLERIYRTEYGPALPAAARGPIAAAHQARAALREAFIAQEHFTPWLLAFAKQHPEQLTPRDQHLQRYVLGPYIAAVVHMLTSEPAQMPRAFLRTCSQSPRLRDALTFVIVEQWPAPARADHTATQICDQNENLAQYNGAIPDRARFFLHRFSMVRIAPLLERFVEHNMALASTLGASTRATGADADADGAVDMLWARTQVVLLGLAKRNTYWLMLQAEPVFERLGHMVAALPPDVQEAFLQRFSALLAACNRTAFFRADEPAGQRYAADAQASQLCIEHLLPPTVAICRSLPAAQAARLAAAYVAQAQQKTDAFHSDTHCGLQKRLQVRIAAQLAPFLLALPPAADLDPAHTAWKAACQHWLAVMLPNAKEDGFVCLDGLLTAVAERALALTSPAQAAQWVDDALIGAIAEDRRTSTVTGAMDGETPRTKGLYLLKYLSSEPAWLQGRAPGPVAARIVRLLFGEQALPPSQGPDALSTGPFFEMVVTGVDAGAMQVFQNSLIAARLLVRVLDNPRVESLRDRLEALLQPEAQHEDLVDIFRARASQIASVLCDARGIRVARDVMQQAAASAAGEQAIVFRAIEPAMALMTVWLADQAQDIGTAAESA